MSNNKIQDLRRNLFETLEGVRKGTIPLDTAKVIVQVGQAIINSVKVEVDFIKAVNASSGSGFIELEDSSFSNKEANQIGN